MKKIIGISTILFPHLLFAQAEIPDFKSFVNIIIGFLPQVLSIIALVVFLYFVWRVAQFILHADSAETRSSAQRVFIWGIFTLLVIASLTAIIALLLGELGLGELIIPKLPSDISESSIQYQQ